MLYKNRTKGEIAEILKRLFTSIPQFSFEKTSNCNGTLEAHSHFVRIAFIVFRMVGLRFSSAAVK